MASELMSKEYQRSYVLLRLLYWWDGWRGAAPAEVTKHPLWPANNDLYMSHLMKRDFLSTPCPGRDRLWEAIEQELGFKVRD